MRERKREGEMYIEKGEINEIDRERERQRERKGGREGEREGGRVKECKRYWLWLYPDALN